MTIEEVKNSLGKMVMRSGGFYRILGFCEQPVVFLELVAAPPGTIRPQPYTIDLPENCFTELGVK